MAAKDNEIPDKYPEVLKAFLDKFGQEEPMPINLDVNNFITFIASANCS